MKLEKSQGPDEGSFTIVFRCPKCGRDVAMLTNPLETQLVRALDVKIGGKRQKAEPMKATRNSLSSSVIARHVPKDKRELTKQSDADSSGCPFTEIVNESYEKDSNVQPASQQGGHPVWSKEAEERLARIPEMVRPMAKVGVEHYAKEKGYKEITLKVLEEAKDKFGM
jgi:hypothetical protein